MITWTSSPTTSGLSSRIRGTGGGGRQRWRRPSGRGFCRGGARGRDAGRGENEAARRRRGIHADEEPGSLLDDAEGGAFGEREIEAAEAASLAIQEHRPDPGETRAPQLAPLPRPACAPSAAAPDKKNPSPSATPPSHLLVTRAQPFEFATMLAWGARLVNPKVEDVDWPCYANSRRGNLHAGRRGGAPPRGCGGGGGRAAQQRPPRPRRRRGR